MKKSWLCGFLVILIGTFLVGNTTTTNQAEFKPPIPSGVVQYN